MMNMIEEVYYLRKAIKRFEKTGERFYKEKGIMVLVNEHSIKRYKELTRKQPLK